MGRGFRQKVFQKFPKSFRKVPEKFAKRFRMNQTSIRIPFGNAFQNPTKHQKISEFRAFKSWKGLSEFATALLLRARPAAF